MTYTPKKKFGYTPVTIPFLNDNNTLWWDFRSSQFNNGINDVGDDTLAFSYENISKSVYVRLEQNNKSKQPLIKTINGIDFNRTTQRKMYLINNTGICNGTNGIYCAFNIKPTTASTTLLRISGASTSTTSARCWIEMAGGSSTPQIRAKIGNNDSSTLSTLGLTPTGAIPNVSTNLWSTVEVEINLSSGVAVMRSWINGTLQTLASPTTPTHTTTYLSTNPNLFVLGNTLGDSETASFDGEIQQMIFYNGVPSTGVRSSISSYLVGVKP